MGSRYDIRKFIPPLLIRNPKFAQCPTHDAAALFVDVADFTGLSERLAARGAEGAEILDQVISTYLTQVAEIIEKYGGSPIKISGDALASVFVDADKSLEDLGLLALACAVELRGLKVKGLPELGGGRTLSLTHKIGVEVGQLVSGVVGDPNIREEFVFFGPALDGATAAEERAAPGQVLVAPNLVAVLGQAKSWEQVDQAGFGLLAERTPPLMSPGRHCGDSHRRTSDDEPATPVVAHPALIPRIIRAFAEEKALSYVTGHQGLTVLFARCTDLARAGPDALYKLDAHYREMQRLVHEYGGFLSEFEAGARGARLIALFGAPTVLEDARGQAARCALAMQQAARDLGVVRDQRIGLARGRMYVGLIGCHCLVKFSAMGDRMNLAARLMEKADEWSVLAERSVLDPNAKGLNCGKQVRLTVKGKAEVIEAVTLKTADPLRGQDRRGQGLIGRCAEKKALFEALEALREGKGGIFRIKGVAGIGKTRLLGAFRSRVRDAKNCLLAEWNGASVNARPPLCAFVPLLIMLTGCDRSLDAKDVYRLFGEWLREQPRGARLGLLSFAARFGLCKPTTSWIDSLPEVQKLAKQRRCLVESLLHCSDHNPMILLLDQAERLDMQSVQTLQELSLHLDEHPFLIVLAHRSDENGGQGHCVLLDGLANTTSRELGALTAVESLRFARRCFRVKQLDQELIEWLEQRAAGNPMLIEAWIGMLRNHGLVYIENQVARLRIAEELPNLPDELEALIMIQVERFSPSIRLTLGVAAVVGQSFTMEDVVALHPEDVTEGAIEAQLRQVAKNGLLWHDRAQQRRMFFPRPEIRKAIHDRLSFEHRRFLHARRLSLLKDRTQGELSDNEILVRAEHYQYTEDCEGQRNAYLSALLVSKKRFDHRETIRWGKKYLRVIAESGARDGVLEVTPILDMAFASLGETDERRQLIESWLSEAKRTGEIASMISAMSAKAHLLQWSGDFDAACAELEEARLLAESSGAPDLLLRVLLRGISIRCEAGRLESALRVAEDAFGLLKPEDKTCQTVLYGNVGSARAQLGQKEKALEAFECAMASGDAGMDLLPRVSVESYKGLTLLDMGLLERGHESLLNALRLCRRIGAARREGSILLNVGLSYFSLGNLPQARRHTLRAARLLGALHYRRGETAARLNLGEILGLTGNLDESAAEYGYVRTILEKHNFAPHEAGLFIGEGDLALAQNAPTAALQSFERGLQVALGLRDKEFECNSCEGSAEAYRLLGRLEKARASIDDAIRLVEIDPHLVHWPQRVFWRASVIAADMGDDERARAMSDRAYDILLTQLARLSTPTARKRMMRAFPWNRAILRKLTIKEVLARVAEAAAEAAAAQNTSPSESDAQGPINNLKLSA